jgi:hypothetical protein
MSFRILALVAASLLFATQSHAAPVKGGKSINLKQTKQTGRTKAGAPTATNTDGAIFKGGVQFKF